MEALEFGAYLKKLRKEKKLTIRQLDLYSGVSNSYISQMERGERGIPSPDILKKLSKALGVDYEQLMKAAGYIDEGKVVKLKEELQKITGMPKSEERKKKVADFMQEFLKLPEETQDNFYDLIKNMPKK